MKINAASALSIVQQHIDVCVAELQKSLIRGNPKDIYSNQERLIHLRGLVLLQEFRDTPYIALQNYIDAFVIGVMEAKESGDELDISANEACLAALSILKVEFLLYEYHIR